MKLRSGHIAILVLALIGGFVIFAVTWKPGATTAPPAADLPPGAQANADFLKTVHEEQEKTPMQAGVGSILPGGADEGGPRIEIPTLDLDVGLMPNDALGRYQMPVKNTGNLPLQVQQVTTSCECTRGEVPPGGFTLPPGGEGTIEIIVDPYRIPGFEATRHLTIKSTDPITPFLEFNVTSHITPEFSLEPESFDFGTVEKGAPAALTMRIRQLRDEAVVVDKADGHGPFDPSVDRGDFEAEVTPVPEDQWQQAGKAEYDLTVRLKDTVPIGKLDTRVYLLNNVKRIQALPLKVTAEITAPYSVEPALGDVLGVPNKADMRATIKVSGTDGIAIENVVVKPELFSATVRDEDEATAAYIDVELNLNAPAGAIRDFVHFDVVADGKRYSERTDAHAVGVGPPAAAASGE
ncbi:MAG: DUF1573 domain-containing protein [Candidatus Hydrogenedens sp.]|nr:DUF1573 domain-containing protein [Candidatus Hydrogenedens sp.]